MTVSEVPIVTCTCVYKSTPEIQGASLLRAHFLGPVVYTVKPIHLGLPLNSLAGCVSKQNIR